VLCAQMCSKIQAAAIEAKKAGRGKDPSLHPGSE
jgi:hypothetical protein